MGSLNSTGAMLVNAASQIGYPSTTTTSNRLPSSNLCIANIRNVHHLPWLERHSSKPLHCIFTPDFQSNFRPSHWSISSLFFTASWSTFFFNSIELHFHFIIDVNSISCLLGSKAQKEDQIAPCTESYVGSPASDSGNTEAKGAE